MRYFTKVYGYDIMAVKTAEWRDAIMRLLIWFFVFVAVWICSKLPSGIQMSSFIAVIVLGHYGLSGLFCSWIAAFRFDNPKAKYIEVKNKVLRFMLIGNPAVEKVYFRRDEDNRINIVGLVLHAINFLLFVSFEILLIMPKMPCPPYIFTISIPRSRYGGNRQRSLDFELDCINEIIAAEGSRAFMFVTGLVFIVFLFIFMHRLEKHRKMIGEKKKNNPPGEKLKNTEWYYPLYKELVGIALRKNNKKHRFWYDCAQINEIEELVSKHSKNTQIMLEKRGRRYVSFKVIDTYNDHIVFEGRFV